MDIKKYSRHKQIKKPISKSLKSYKSSNVNNVNSSKNTINNEKLSSKSSHLAFPYVSSHQFIEELPLDICDLIQYEKKDFLEKYCLHLSHWKITIKDFKKISLIYDSIHSIKLDYCLGLSIYLFKVLQEKIVNLRVLHLRKTLRISIDLINFLQFTSMTLQDIDFSENDIQTNSLCLFFKNAINLESIVLESCSNLDNLDLLALSQLMTKYHKVRRLSLQGNDSISDEGVLTIFGSTSKKGLGLDQINLSNCKKLTTLAFTSCNVYCHTLRYLYINNLKEVPNIVQYISDGFVNLTHLELSSNSDFCDDDMMYIAKGLKRLQTLEVNNCIQLSDYGVKTYCENYCNEDQYYLKVLNISGCIKCSDMAIMYISSCVLLIYHLETIRINGISNLSEGTLALFFQKAMRLRHFELSPMTKVAVLHRKSTVPHITDKVLQVASSHSLIHLQVHHAILLSDRAISMYLTSMKQLTRLDLSHCANVADETMEAIGYAMKNLEDINITCCNKVSNNGFTMLIQGCRNLKSINAMGCSKLSNIAIQKLRTLGKTLEYLSLASCGDDITDEALVIVFQSCINIRHVNLNNLIGVTIKTIQSIISNCSQLHFLSCERCDIIPTLFNQVFRKNSLVLPFVYPIKGQLITEKYDSSIRVFNECQRILNKLSACVNIIQKYWKKYVMRKMNKENMDIELKESSSQVTSCIKGIFITSKSRVHYYYLHIDSINQIQRWMRCMLGIYYAKLKYHYLLKCKRASILIQKIYRRHQCRKWYRLRLYRQYIQHIRLIFFINKYKCIYFCRKLVTFIIRIQTNTRRFLSKQVFKRLYNAMNKIKTCIRRYIFQYRNELLNQVFIQRLRYQSLNRSIIYRNLKLLVFNRRLVKFIIQCGRFFDYQYHQIVIIQKHIRRYIAIQSFQLIKLNIIYLQSHIRKWYIHHLYIPLKETYYRIKRLWFQLIIKLPRRRLGIYVLKIQRLYRIYISKCIFYNYLQESLYKHDLIHKIQSCYLHWKYKQLKYQRYCRYHMAALRIQRRFVKVYIYDFIQMRNKVMKAKEYKDLLEYKVDVNRQRRLKIIKKISDDYNMRCIKKIQRVFRSYLEKKKMMKMIPLAHVVDDKDNLMLKSPSRPTTSSNTILESSREVITQIGSLLSSIIIPSNVIVSKDNFDRLKYAVLTHQTQTILQEGISELHMTYGLGEYKSFQLLQTNNKNNKLSYFIPLANDISSHLDYEVYLWIQYGSGRECMTNISCKAIPTNRSLSFLNDRVVKERSIGHKICWNSKLPFEFIGICGHMKGESAYAIKDMKVLPSIGTQYESEKLQVENYHIIANLSSFGFDCLVFGRWIAQKMEQEVLFPIIQLKNKTWMSNDIIKMMKVC